MNCLQHMLREMFRKMVGVAARNIIEWEVEETSADESVDSME